MAASPQDLTTLANVKAWLKVTSTTDDGVLQRLITQNSRLILDYLQRAAPHISQTYNDTDDGRDQSHLFLDNWPVTSVQQVTIDGQVIPQAVDGSGPTYNPLGWKLQPWNGYDPGGPQSIELVGYRFCRGNLNVQVTYTAGYLVQGEAWTIPATPGPYTIDVLAPSGPWSKDAGVVYADGSGSLQAVSGAPAAGQYAVTAGAYTFNAADEGRGVLISYSFIPGTLEDAAISLVSERFRMRDRIGEKSRTVPGQTTASYDTSAIPSYIEISLRQYRRNIPVV